MGSPPRAEVMDRNGQERTSRNDKTENSKRSQACVNGKKWGECLGTRDLPGAGSLDPLEATSYSIGGPAEGEAESEPQRQIKRVRCSWGDHAPKGGNRVGKSESGRQEMVNKSTPWSRTTRNIEGTDCTKRKTSARRGENSVKCLWGEARRGNAQGRGRKPSSELKRGESRTRLKPNGV